MQTHELYDAKTRRSRGFPAVLLRQLFAACSLLAFLAGTSAGATPIRIMPLGDSITFGDGNGGYRGPLYQMFTSATSTIDFVGSLSSGAITDPDHEGHSGWRADQIRDSLPGWLTTAHPDIILLHIGTNDITQGQGAVGTVAEIGQILDVVDSYETLHQTPVTVILARIINRSDPLDVLGLETTALNISIATMATARIAAGDRLVVADHESALSYPGDLADTVHPKATGYQKMAAVWFDVLYSVLRHRGAFVSDTIPRAMIPGRTYDCSVTMRNAGNEAWLCQPAGTMLTVGQTGGPIANQLIPYPYFEIYINPCRIDIGQDCTFPFTVSVPGDTPLGEYEISWQMKDSAEWFDSDVHNAVFRKTVPVRLYPFYKGDFDDDGDVDQDDFGHLQTCLSGSYLPQGDPNCAGADFDGDSDVDQQDLNVFRRCSSGANNPPDASCIKW